MSSLVSLIQNENMKIYRRVSTWVMIGLLILLLMGFGFLTRFVIKETVDENWQQSLTERNVSLEEMVSDPYLFGPKHEFRNEIIINQYRIENDIEPVEMATFWGFVKEAVGITSIITMFTIIIGAGIVANEFSWGTIKLLLIRPVSRGKVLLSKYISTFGFALFPFISLIHLFDAR